MSPLDCSPYLVRPLRPLAQVRARRIVKRMIALSRSYADRGNAEAARRVWRKASDLSRLCGGVSGATWQSDGHGGIVIDNGEFAPFVAFSPVPLIERAA